MRQHRTDLFALLAGLAFAIAGVGVIVSQATDSGLSGRATAATGLILLGAVALAVTLARTLRDPLPYAEAHSPAAPHAPAAPAAPPSASASEPGPEPVSPEDPAG